MKWVMTFFLLSLKLYPRSFLAMFATEIESVFRSGLEEAHKQGMMLRFVLRELLHLPVSLVGVYILSMRTGEKGQMAVSGVSGGGTTRVPMPGEGWSASFLAGLPHLLMGIFMVSSALISAEIGINQKTFGYFQVTICSLILLGVLLFSIYKGWKRWSASWIAYMFIFAVAILSLVANAITQSLKSNSGWMYGILTLSILLMLAYLLYKTACIDRLRGLLAAVPIMALIWVYFQEFVPILPQSLAWAWLFMLAFISSVMMLRTKRFTVALGLAMAVPILGGFPFAYLGVYMGGTLPFSQPGPNLQEVFRQYLPFLAMVLTIALGPQLAIKLRAVGVKSAEAGGKIFYRLALGGLLLGLALTLLQWAIMTNGIHIQGTVGQVGLIAAAALYLIGFVLLVRAAVNSEAQLGNNGITLQLAALFIPLLFVPVVIILAIPMMSTYLEGWLISLAEIAWVFAAIWVIKD
jgi:hypothetical protein